MNFSIRSNIHDYEVSIEKTPDFIDTLIDIPQACFVIDENVWNIYAKTLLKKIPSFLEYFNFVSNWKTDYSDELSVTRDEKNHSCFLTDLLTESPTNGISTLL